MCLHFFILSLSLSSSRLQLFLCLPHIPIGILTKLYTSCAPTLFLLFRFFPLPFLCTFLSIVCFTRQCYCCCAATAASSRLQSPIFPTTPEYVRSPNNNTNENALLLHTFYIIAFETTTLATTAAAADQKLQQSGKSHVRLGTMVAPNKFLFCSQQNYATFSSTTTYCSSSASKQSYVLFSPTVHAKN